MFAKSYGAVTFGVDGRIIDVEVDVSYGFPAFDIVGLLDTAVKESRERVRTAIKNTGVKLKPARVTINLAPADIRKDSSGLDLPIAVGLLAAYGLIPTERIEHALFAAELSLEGELRSVRGMLPMTVGAKEHGFKEIFVAPGNGSEALLVGGIRVYAPKNLRELYDFLLGKTELFPLEATPARRAAEARQVDAGSPAPAVGGWRCDGGTGQCDLDISLSYHFGRGNERSNVDNNTM